MVMSIFRHRLVVIVFVITILYITVVKMIGFNSCYERFILFGLMSILQLKLSSSIHQTLSSRENCFIPTTEINASLFSENISLLLFRSGVVEISHE